VSETIETLVNEARRLAAQGRLEQAIDAYARLLTRWPALPNSWYNLGLLYRKAGDMPAALRCYQKALDHGISCPEEVHLNRGVIYTDWLQDHAAAERELEHALSLNPNYIPALINRANLHEDLGCRELAQAVYERVLALAPESPEVLARYAGLHKFSSMDDPLIGRLRSALERGGISAAERASLGFALGRALDQCEAYPAAFAAYAAANRDSRRSAGHSFREYDPLGHERDIERLIAAFPAQPEPLASPSPRRTPAVRPKPLFICGMFRSGSTLVEQLLAGHPGLATGGELAFLPQAVRTRLAPFPESLAARPDREFMALAGEYSRMIHDLAPAADFVIDKRPDNYLYIGLIKRLFPEARIVHTTRNALDNCLSIYFLHLDQEMSYALDLEHIGHHYRQYRRLMAHWQSVFGDDIVHVNYDELVHDTGGPMRHLLASLGLEWNDHCTAVSAAGRAVKTASVWQVREPLYRRSSGRSRNYTAELRTLREYLEGLPDSPV
jgi:tetratricopeptide (TPR) repeat protein